MPKRYRRLDTPSEYLNGTILSGNRSGWQLDAGFRFWRIILVPITIELPDLTAQTRFNLPAGHRFLTTRISPSSPIASRLIVTGICS